MDRISELPEVLIENILLKLPLVDQVKTSILSIGWRRRWSKLPSLVINGTVYCDFFHPSKFTWRKKRGSNPKPALNNQVYLKVVSSIILQHTGHLREFSLYIPSDDEELMPDFVSPLHFVLLNGVESLSLSGHPEIPYVLSLSFDVVGLKQLKLKNCELCLPPRFHVFPNLLSLSLDCLSPLSDLIPNLFSSAPLLEILELSWPRLGDQVLAIPSPRLHSLSISGEFNSVSLWNPQAIENFKLYFTARVLRMPFVDMNFLHTMINLKHLTLGAYTCQILARGTELPRFHQLITLSFDELSLHDIIELNCMLSLSTSSPNLRKLDITAYVSKDGDQYECQSVIKKYKNHYFDSLRTINIRLLGGSSKIGINLIELLLSCSALLELMSIKSSCKLGIVELVTGMYRESPMAKVQFLK